MQAFCPMARLSLPRNPLRHLVKGLLLGVTMTLGIQVPAVGQRVDQTAMSVPRPAQQDRAAGFPQPLAPSEAARLRRIFDLQARGEPLPAAREVERLEDRRLLGHVLADRWLRPGAEPPLHEVVDWLTHHGDHPDAPAIHAILARRAPPGMALPAAPAFASLDGAEEVPEEREPATRRIQRSPGLDRLVRERWRDGDIAGALATIERSRAEGAYAALLRAEVAQYLLQIGRDEEAFTIASAAARVSGGSAFPGYIAGLAAWALNRPEAALAYFEHAARSDIAAPATRGEGEGAAIAETAAGWRALALLQIGQKARAEAELRVLWPRVQGNAGVVRAMLVVANQAGMADLAARLASLSQSADGRPRDFARFPLPRLEPMHGFRMDPALLYALARQESNFNPGAVSPAGARGILQIMPATASYVTGDSSLRGANVARLHDPGFSLEVGQRYVHYLARSGQVDGDLIRLLAAYNNGPGNLSRWLPAVRHRTDPFLFIESIPVGETRLFVQRVLAYSWIYAARLGLPSPSLDALATGRFPRFQGTAAVAAMLISR
ncbi:MAG: hypothetical protein B7Z53_02415 [Rhodospirillales bacterium 12-71-4]|nr:MAG: hypothetical protein B7Z53_02415 [Rhodospirillales bacterium 12-71-4]